MVYIAENNHLWKSTELHWHVFQFLFNSLFAYFLQNITHRQNPNSPFDPFVYLCPSKHSGREKTSPLESVGHLATPMSSNTVASVSDTSQRLNMLSSTATVAMAPALFAANLPSVKCVLAADA